MTLEFGILSRKELRQAAELAARAFSDYEYFTNWFPDDEVRAKVEISIIWHSYKTNFNRVHQLTAKLDGKNRPYQHPGLRLPGSRTVNNQLLLFMSQLWYLSKADEKYFIR